MAYSCTYSYFWALAFVTLCLPVPVWVSEAPLGGPCCVAVNCDGCKETDRERGRESHRISVWLSEWEISSEFTAACQIAWLITWVLAANQLVTHAGNQTRSLPPHTHTRTTLLATNATSNDSSYNFHWILHFIMPHATQYGAAALLFTCSLSLWAAVGI